jgi:hypothetical protein
LYSSPQHSLLFSLSLPVSLVDMTITTKKYEERIYIEHNEAKMMEKNEIEERRERKKR